MSFEYTETYRSGHNGADSKSVREQSPASSNLAVSANVVADFVREKRAAKHYCFAAFIVESIMEFLTSYKRLDNLCKDMNGVGVSGYIEDMENIKAEIFSVKSWKDDYFQLKHYRYIRNRIAHDNDAYEEMLCTPADAEWLENFYQQILKQTDPLALSHRISVKNDLSTNQKVLSYQAENYNISEPKSKRNNSGWLIAVFVILAVLILAVVIYIFYSTIDV